MNKNWEDIIKNKLQNDAVTPPPSAWEAINDSAWTNKIKSKSQQASHPPVPKKLTHQVFQQNHIQHILGGISLKAAAIVIGITASALAIYTQTKNQNPQTSNSQPQTEITTSPINPLNPNLPTPNSLLQTPLTSNPQTSNSQSHTEITASPINPITLITQTPNSQLQTEETQTLNPQLQTEEILYSKSLTLYPLNPLNPSELFPDFPRKKASKPSHLKPNFSLYAGLQQRLNRIVYTQSRERGAYQHWPVQRDQGLIVGLTLNDKWVLETGIFNASAQSNLALSKLPYYKTPIKIHPQRKVIEIHTPHHQTIIDARGVALHPNGTNWRDTTKFYAISFEENHRAQFIEIPLSMGYKHTWRRFLFSAQLGGMLLLPQKIQSDFRLSINNNENTTFEFSQEKTVKNKALYQGFVQMQVGYYLIPQLNTYINVLLPGLHENNPNAIVSAQNLRFQVGLNYHF